MEEGGALGERIQLTRRHARGWEVEGHVGLSLYKELRGPVLQAGSALN